MEQTSIIYRASSSKIIEDQQKRKTKDNYNSAHDERYVEYRVDFQLYGEQSITDISDDVRENCHEEIIKKRETL